MSVLPRVTELTREQISREFDDLGPEACMAEIRADLQRHNPELLDMASRWAGDGRETKSLMTAFGMFYRLMTAEALAPLGVAALNPLPRVSAEVRDSVIDRIEESAPKASPTRRSTISRPPTRNFCRWRTATRPAARITLVRCKASPFSTRPCYCSRGATASAGTKAQGGPGRDGRGGGREGAGVGQGPSVGAVWLLSQLARDLGTVAALGSDRRGSRRCGKSSRAFSTRARACRRCGWRAATRRARRSA